MPFFSGLHPDPAGCERLAAKLQPVCASVSAGDQVTREQLKNIARDPKRNPFNVRHKNWQFFSNTCASNSGESVVSAFFWKHTGIVRDFSRLWLYLKGKTRWDWKAGRCIDDGCSIPSIAETLHEDGIPFETTWAFEPDASKWPNFTQFQKLQTPALIAEAALNKLPKITPVSADFDVTIARVAMGDYFFWGSGWSPFPNGRAAHATAALWFHWDDRLGDFVLDFDNSHQGNEHFTCDRKTYQWAMRYSVPNFGAFHAEGAVDLRFRAQQMVM